MIEHHYSLWIVGSELLPWVCVAVWLILATVAIMIVAMGGLVEELGDERSCEGADPAQGDGRHGNAPAAASPRKELPDVPWYWKAEYDRHHERETR